MTIQETLRLALMIAVYRVQHGTGIHVLVPMVHVWVVAPDYPRLRQWWRELKVFMDPRYVARINEKDQSIELSVTADKYPQILIEMKSGVDPESLVSAGLDILVITEASLVKERCWTESLMPSLGSPGRMGIYILNGTPKGRNWFYREYESCIHEMQEKGDKSDFFAMRCPSTDNPYLDLEWFNKISTKMPSRKRKQELMAEFLGAGEGYFPDPRQRIIRAGSIMDYQYPFFMGIDWGRFDNPTVFITIDAAGRMVHRETIQGKSFNAQFEALHKIVDALPCTPGQLVFVPEEAGLQVAFSERIQTEFDVGRRDTPRLEPFRNYGTAKVDAMEQLSMDLEADAINGIWLLDEPNLINQIEIFEDTDLRDARRIKDDEGDFHHHFDEVLALAAANKIRHYEMPYMGQNEIIVTSSMSR